MEYVIPNLEQGKSDHTILASSLMLGFGKWPSGGGFDSSSTHFNAVALNDPEMDNFPIHKGTLEETYKKTVDNL